MQRYQFLLTIADIDIFTAKVSDTDANTNTLIIFNGV